ncbi:sodium-coupled neutral amino acid transporter 9 homolog isoform X2 [Battus philenor]|uniref:sodium-coupled neutral amino acid transporter 9 homolog isoform X2 n=1 Tax=Battus philenor TaxID=42288 RepID=UPI0035D0A465
MKMRLIRDLNRREDVSAPSSVRSTDSYGIFGNEYSDISDCECLEDGQHFENYKTPFYPGYCRILGHRNMECEETTPLLSAAAVRKSVSCSDSLGPGEISDGDVLETYKRIEKENKEDAEKKKQSSLVTIFSVWNTIMGSSLLTMAWGVERAGLTTALVLVAGMAALCLYTAHLLLRVNRHHGSAACEVPALCRVLLGPWAEAVAHIFSLLVLVGANIVYWLLIANFLYHTVNYFMDLSPTNGTRYSDGILCPKHEALLEGHPVPAPSPYWGLHTTVPFYVALGIFPLLNFANVTFFTKFNSLGTLSVGYLIVFVIYKGATWGGHGSGSRGAGLDAAALSGMLALSFYIHNIIITIMTNNRRQENNGRDLSIAFLLVTVTYTLVGAVFYICFPLDKSCIEDNILNNFEMHDVLTAVARALLLFQVVTVFPLVAYMLRREAVLLLPFQESRRLTVCINLTLVAVCILVACLCPNIGTIIRYTGAISGLVHIFALPSLLQVRSLQLRGKLTFWKALLYFCIVLFGVTNFIMQFLITE